jgi:hypothetical protein
VGKIGRKSPIVPRDSAIVPTISKRPLTSLCLLVIEGDACWVDVFSIFLVCLRVCRNKNHTQDKRLSIKEQIALYPNKTLKVQNGNESKYYIWEHIIPYKHLEREKLATSY